MTKSVAIDRILTILVCVFLLGTIYHKDYSFSSAKPTIPDDSLLKDVTPGELQNIIGSYKGKKAVLVNVWATWCAPCVEEFPHIVKLQRNYPDNLKVIFISADFKQSRGKALSFLKEQEVDWTTYFKTGKDQPFIESLSKEWTGALPFTKVIGVDGKVVASWEQSANYSKFERHRKTAINR
jgi:thiol-disulfide isomerase/thioredoxin